MAGPNPYDDLGPAAFWRSAVAGASGEDISALYRPKFALTRDMAFATAGSCFAQHLGRALRGTGCTVVDCEPAPAGLPDDIAARYGYGLYSCRYGNIYTSRQMVQLVEEAMGERPPSDLLLERDGAVFDALRPTVEPHGLQNMAEMRAHRMDHLAAVGRMLAMADVFVFTLGMTEAWEDIATTRALPTCPGVVAGRFDPAATRFANFRYPDVLADLTRLRALLHEANPGIRLLLTVSPVPLTATASGQHVLAATTWSKATLRAVAGDFAAAHDDVDYVPSYEIVTSPAARGAWYQPNLREVRPEAVARVMATFLSAHGLAEAPAPLAPPPEDDSQPPAQPLVCEDSLLDAFGR